MQYLKPATAQKGNKRFFNAIKKINDTSRNLHNKVKEVMLIKKVTKLIKNSDLIVIAVRFIWSLIEAPLTDYFNLKKRILLMRVIPYTMSRYKRLANVYELSQLIEKNKIEGAFVECGVYKGGCIAVMAYVAKQARSGRKVWLFDSFEGLPEPSEDDGIKAKKYASNRNFGKLSPISECVGRVQDVKKILFSKLKIDKKNTIIKKGWFQNTLPEINERIGKISILRLDGDWYDSTKCCLKNLFKNVVPGGYIILDDYGAWEGCKKATDEFLSENNLDVELKRVDYTCVYFQIPYI